MTDFISKDAAGLCLYFGILAGLVYVYRTAKR